MKANWRRHRSKHGLMALVRNVQTRSVHRMLPPLPATWFGDISMISLDSFEAFRDAQVHEKTAPRSTQAEESK
jgi:hypothetical protein